jgi:hypothetical protein
MPAIIKDKLLQIRIEQGLHDRLAVICDQTGGTVSAAVRHLIQKHVEGYERRVQSKVKGSATMRSSVSASKSVRPEAKLPVETSAKPQNRAERRKAERAARAAQSLVSSHS